MALLIFIYIGIATFLCGNAYRVLRIARTPAHLRWELYPMPKGTREQQSHGGSYFEETEWWKQPRRGSRAGELLYIVREVFAFTTLRKRNRPLWLWSWFMHTGLYLLAVAVILSSFARVPGEMLSRIVGWTATIASCAGIAGVVGLLVRRANAPLRGLSSRLAWSNLVLIGSLFGSALIALSASPGELIALPRTLLRTGPAPEFGVATSLHLVIAGIFLAYFPATHMTHAYMKFFTYHRVRWDDAAAVHAPSMAKAMATNVGRPISWAAPHIATGSRNTWATVVARSSNKEVRP